MQILPRMEQDPNMFVVFNLLAKKQELASNLTDLLSSTRQMSLINRILFLANPPVTVDAAGDACTPEWRALPVLRAAGMAVVDGRKLILPYLTADAAGRLPLDSDGPAVVAKTEDHWGGPMQRAVLRQVLTRVASARYAAGSVTRPPEPFT